MSVARIPLEHKTERAAELGRGRVNVGARVPELRAERGRDCGDRRAVRLATRLLLHHTWW